MKFKELAVGDRFIYGSLGSDDEILFIFTKVAKKGKKFNAIRQFDGECYLIGGKEKVVRVK